MSIRPIKQCYWVVPDKFLAGEYPRTMDDKSSQEKINALLGAGVTAFIDLTEGDEGLLPYSHLLNAGDANRASYQRFPIRDFSIPRSREFTSAILDAVDQHMQKCEIVYLHCWGGVGRTGTIVGCWLARHGYEGKPALIRLSELWRQCPKSAYQKSPETREQEQYILDWEKAQ
jgi:protein-tyrosine phosphatase